MTKNRHKITRIKIVDDFESRADYLCFVAGRIASGFYQKYGFSVLPRLSPARKTVYFPDLAYPPKFWRKLKATNLPDAGKTYPKELREIALALLPKTDLTSAKIKLARFAKKLPQSRKTTVLLSEFGPRSSFSPGFLIFRADRKPNELTDGLISLAVLDKYGPPRGSEEKQLRQIYYSEYRHKHSPKQDLTDADRKASQKFLEKLGFSRKRKLKMADGRIYLGERNLSRILSPQENLVLRELLLSKVLTHDRMAEILWGEQAEEKFSLWAETKLIQKLRRKLQNAGASCFLIKTIYGQGYSLDT